MAEIGRVGAGGPARPARGPGRAAGGFAVPAEGAAAPTAADAGAAIGAVGLGLLSLQEREDPAARDGAARRRAESILQELHRLQRELLRDGGDTTGLDRLAALAAGEEGADPGLREAVRAIVLRARVELARRGRNDAMSTP